MSKQSYARNGTRARLKLGKFRLETKAGRRSISNLSDLDRSIDSRRLESSRSRGRRRLLAWKIRNWRANSKRQRQKSTTEGSLSMQRTTN